MISNVIIEVHCPPLNVFISNLEFPWILRSRILVLPCRRHGCHHQSIQLPKSYIAMAVPTQLTVRATRVAAALNNAALVKFFAEPTSSAAGIPNASSAQSTREGCA